MLFIALSCPPLVQGGVGGIVVSLLLLGSAGALPLDDFGIAYVNLGALLLYVGCYQVGSVGLCVVSRCWGELQSLRLRAILSGLRHCRSPAALHGVLPGGPILHNVCILGQFCSMHRCRAAWVLGVAT